MENKRLHFNGIDMDTQTWRIAPMTEAKLAARIQIAAQPDPMATKDLVSWANPKDIAQTGWGLIVHEDENPAVLEALDPLLNRRRAMAGKRFQTFTYLRHDTLDYRGFMNRHHITHTDVDPDNAPYYLLIVGPPDRIPFQFQYELGITHGVGRIDFEDPAQYQSYAENVCRTEKTQHTRPARFSLFGAENDELTELSSQKLVLPLQDKLIPLMPNWQCSSWVGDKATKAQLHQLMGGEETPALLFTAGHGVYFSKDKEKRINSQGSLICSDWPGHGIPLEEAHYYGPQDVPLEADLRGTILFHFSCFTAGTPEFDNFLGPNKTKRHNSKPFVAPLPKRLLALENGPLAIVGHVDSAFQYSFMWDRKLHEIDHFSDAFYKLANGFPIGAAMESFNRRFAIVGAVVAGEIMNTGLNDTQKLRYWIAYHDARNYLILGDPALSIKVRI